MIKSFFQYKKLLFFFCLMTGITGCFNSFAMMRDVIMILDKEKGEIGREIDAMLDHLHAALHQKAAPIIVSATVWNAFATMAYSFYLKSRKRNSLEQLYMEAYNIVQKNIDESIRDNPNNHAYEAIKRHFNTVKSKEWKDLVSSGSDLVKQVGATQGGIIFNRWAMHTLWFFDNTDEWDVYQSSNLIVLIPHTYKNKLLARKEKLPNVLFRDKKTNRELTAQERVLGIKVGNLKRIVPELFSWGISFDEPTETNGGKTYPDQLNNIFANKDDIVNANQKLYYPFIWNIYLTGHGSYTVNPTLTKRLDQDIAKLKNIRQEIEEYYILPAEHTGQELFVGLKNYIQQLRQKIASLQQNGSESDQQEAKVLKIRADKLDTNIVNFEKVLRVIDIKLRVIGPKALIAGLSYPVFKQFLKFFNQKIRTNLLCYDTCFAGKRNLLFPYISKWGMPEKYHFTIVSITISDDVTTAFRRIYDPFSTSLVWGHLDNIDIYKKRGRTGGKLLPLKMYQDFNAFFAALNVDKLLKEGKQVSSLQETIQKVSYPRTTLEIAQHVPGIRLPGAQTFNALDFDNITTRITKVLLSQAQLKGGLFIDFSEKPIMVLNTYYIPLPIHVKGTSMPYILPMFNKVTAQNVNAVYLQQLVTPTNVDVFGIVNRFLHESFPHRHGDVVNADKNPAPKMFIIDKINEEDMRRVMIFNKIKLPSSIQGNAMHMTGIVFTNEYGSHIRAYTFRSTIDEIETVNKKLNAQQTIEYYQLYETYKREIIEQAKKDNLELIPLAPIEKAIKKKIQKLQ